MGESLDYCTTAAVSPSIRDALQAEALHLVPPNSWRTEPLLFFDSGDEDGL
jgi:hypothetical protein